MSRALALCLVLYAASLSGCATESALERIYVLNTVASDERPATYLGLPLETGQIVLAEGGNPYSLLFSLCTERYFDFTHAGIIVMEDGKPWIYEMTGEYKPGIDDRPTDGIEGGCRRIGLEKYARGYLYLEVFDPPEGVDGLAVAAWAKKQLTDDTPFDPYFNYAEHETLFCTEYVQLALEAGGAPPIELAATQQHPSMRRLLGWLDVDQEAGLPAGLLVNAPRSIGALGSLPTLKAAQGYFAAKRELHRRFTPDQQLGNLFEMTSFSELVLRMPIMHFLARASNIIHDLDERPTFEEAQEHVRGLAAEMFGVAPDSE